MNVLIVTPLQGNTSVRWLPLGISYMASSLKANGHKVMVYDRTLRSKHLKSTDDLDDELMKTINSFRPDLIGLSTVSPVIHDTVSVASRIRDGFSGIIVAGGHHATAMPLETLEKIPELDYVLTGEAEFSLSSLANGGNPDEIPGVYNSRNYYTGKKNIGIADLDDLPFPDYSVFDMNYYTQASLYTLRGKYAKTACVLGSRGCPNNCSFCSESLTYGHGVKYHSAEYIVENIERLLADYDIDSIYFHDNDFMISRQRVEDICKSFVSKGLGKRIQWSVQAGTDRVDDEILGLMSKAGCVSIEFGMESIKESDLDSINKNRLVIQSENAIQLCRENGILSHGYFISGLQGETLDKLDSLMKWISIHRPDTFSLSSLQVNPGTALYTEFGNGFFEKNEWTKDNIRRYYRSCSLSKIKPESLAKWKKEVYEPFRKRYYRKTLLNNNSISDLLRVYLRNRLLFYRFR